MRALLAVLAVLAVSCSGQTSPPTAEELTERLSRPEAYFTVTRPDGVAMWCNFYSEDGSVGQGKLSWFAYDCDWDGVDPEEGMPE